MTGRTITDAAGRAWTCVPAASTAEDHATRQGRDVVLTCTTPSVADPVQVTVGWQWEGMSANGLARLVSVASPIVRR